MAIRVQIKAIGPNFIACKAVCLVSLLVLASVMRTVSCVLGTQSGSIVTTLTALVFVHLMLIDVDVPLRGVCLKTVASVGRRGRPLLHRDGAALHLHTVKKKKFRKCKISRQHAARDF